jgi:hypothetical protein
VLTQSLAPEQLVLQLLPEHMNPPVHAAAADIWQAPFAQVPRAMKFVPEQLAVPQAALG